MVTVPRLMTPRLVLRAPRADDLDAYAEFLSDPEATRYLSGTADRRTAWRVLAALAGAWMLTGAGWWAIERREDGAFVGVVGAFFRETTLPVAEGSDLELGWNVLRPYWRLGYAKEAASAALAHGLARPGASRVVAHMEPDNVASSGVARAIGMSLEGEVMLYDRPALRWVAHRP